MMGDDQGEHGTFRQVEDWLRSLGLICYAQSFYDNGYENLDICRQIQEQDLAVIGIDNVKDKSDILAGVCRLKQKAVYFELEPEEDLSAANVPRKYDPFLLITLVKAELENDNVQLTEPPYFYPDGSLGSLDSLAQTLGFKLETFVEDVLSALDQLRRRQLPAGLYNDVNEMMEMQRQQETKKSLNARMIGPPKPKRESLEEPKAYLNVETPFRRTTSLSKHDKRITKSTTNLTEYGEDMPLALESSKRGKKSKPVRKSYSSREKSKALFGLSIRKRSTTAENKASTKDTFVAKDLTMEQEEIIDLLTKVKHGELSQENVVAQATMNYRKSIDGDVSMPIVFEKHQLTKKEMKRLKKEEKKRKKGEQAKPAGHSLFYTSEIGENFDTKADVEVRQVDDVVSLGHSSGSDVSRESPDFRSFGKIITEGKCDNGAVLFPSDACMHGSNGNLSIQSGTPNVNESREERRFNRVKSVSKPNKQPPPIPKQLDQPSVKSLKETSVVNPEIGGSTLTPISQKRPLKSTLSAPSQAGISRTELPKSEISKSQELSVQKSINEAVQEKSLPKNASVLADKDREETKLKSSEQNQRLVLGFKNDKMNEGKTVMSSSIDPIRLSESQSQNRSSVEHKTSYKCFEGQKPTPPPRKVNKVADKRPVIPPRKHHNVLSEVNVEGTPSNGINKGDADLSKLVPYGHKHDSKSMHPLPFHTELTDTKVKECQKGLEEKNLDSNRIGPSQERIGGAKPDGLGDVLQINENILSQSKRNFKSRTLKELIEMKCEREAVNLLEYPYTVVDGSWNIPFLLTKRYAEELGCDRDQLIESMDHLRSEMAKRHKKPFKPANIKEVVDASTDGLVNTSLNAWLTSIGLPMFIKDFNECGLTSLEDISFLKKKDIMGMGIFEERHIDQLLKYLE